MNRRRVGCQVVFLYVFVAICVTRIAAAVRVNTEPIYRPHRLNVCEPNARAFDPKIVCYCDKIAHDEEFRKADCWVYGNELTEDDVAWDGFGRNNDIKELTFIVYTNSHLRFLPQKGMYYLTDLVKFSLSYADVPNIPAYAFSKLDRLEDVQLVSNQISSLDDYAFSKLDQLKALNLSYNQITEIKRHVFYRNFKMELLHLTSNNITSIRERAFGDLNNLVELRLDHNYLRQLKKGMFNGLTNLVQLSVTGNFITAIEEDTFEHVPSLIRLDLDQNSIQSISGGAFKLLAHLKFLNLEQNELKYLDPNTFYSLSKLSYLNLAKNLLVTLEVDRDGLMVERFLDRNSVLLLYDNNLECDCRLLWLFKIRNRTRSGTIQTSLDNLLCELQENNQQRSEQAFLMRLQYENFVCDPMPTTPNIFEFTKYHSRGDTAKNSAQVSVQNSLSVIVRPYLLFVLGSLLL